jgi:CspA family cold shock protein
MATAKIKRLVKDRGFGFLEGADAAGSDIFFHRDSLPSGVFDQLTEGQSVEFDLGADPRDPRKTRAVNVHLVGVGN